MTSGACGPGLSLLALMASISSAELPSGVELVDRDAVLRREAVEHLAVVAPGVRQGDGREAALGLGRRDELASAGRDAAAAPAADGARTGGRRRRPPERSVGGGAGGEQDRRRCQQTRPAGQGLFLGQGTLLQYDLMDSGFRCRPGPSSAPPTPDGRPGWPVYRCPVHSTPRTRCRQDDVMSSLTARVRHDIPLRPRADGQPRRRVISGSNSGSVATVAGTASPK